MTKDDTIQRARKLSSEFATARSKSNAAASKLAQSYVKAKQTLSQIASSSSRIDSSTAARHVGACEELLKKGHQLVEETRKLEKEILNALKK